MNNEAIVKGAVEHSGGQNQKEGIREDEKATIHLIIGQINWSVKSINSKEK